MSPELAQRIDAQFDTVEPVVRRNEEALAFTSAMSGCYAPTLADARRAFPGRQINTIALAGADAALFIPSRNADPELEAEALQVIQNGYNHARVTGDRTRFEASLDDEVVRQVSRIPRNQASALYKHLLESLRTPQPAPAISSSETQPASDAEGEELYATTEPAARGASSSVWASR